MIDNVQSNHYNLMRYVLGASEENRTPVVSLEG